MPEMLARMIVDGKITLEKIMNDPRYKGFKEKIIEILKEQGREDLIIE